MRVSSRRFAGRGHIAALMTVLIVLASGVLTKLGHATWGLAALAAFCLACSIAEILPGAVRTLRRLHRAKNGRG